MSEANVR